LNRIGIYVDDVYVVDEQGGRRHITVDRAFLLFACEVGRHFDGRAVIGRTRRNTPLADYVLPDDVDLIELPDYSSLFRLPQVVRAAGGTIAAMWRGVAEVDVVWAFGPHPFALPLIAAAALRRKRVVLGVRQNTLGYYRHRLPSRRWKPVLAGIWTLDLVYRLLSRRLPTTVVGSEIAGHYGGPRDALLTMVVTLVRDEDVVAAPVERDWSSDVRLLTVGRFDSEKNPMLLLQALHELDRESPGRYRLIWVGRGPLEDAVRARARELGIEHLLEIRGYVAFGPELLGLYRGAHAFLHVSRTEGVPQVVVEANASGIPVVATAVGGVAAALDDGQAGLLVPPDDLDALVGAIRRVSGDGELRRRMVERGLELARARTFDQEAARVAGFVAGKG
jgi:glycosyltransferase involved in cell wall biosynthesis